MKTMVLLKAFLQRMQGSSFRSKSFNSSHCFSVCLHSQYCTALDTLAIEQDGAGTAAAGITANMCTRKAQDLPDHMNKQQPRFNFK
jgi:hypothetical protein